MIPLKAYNVLDYLIGAILLIVPSLFWFSDVEMARHLFLTSGVAIIVYTAFTNFPYALAKLISVKVHMTLDIIVGVLLAMAPFLFGYRRQIDGMQFGLHIVFGLILIALALLDNKEEARAVDKRNGDIFNNPASPKL